MQFWPGGIAWRKTSLTPSIIYFNTVVNLSSPPSLLSLYDCSLNSVYAYGFAVGALLAELLMTMLQPAVELCERICPRHATLPMRGIVSLLIPAGLAFGAVISFAPDWCPWVKKGLSDCFKRMFCCFCRHASEVENDPESGERR